MANDGDMDVSGIEMTVSGDQLVAALLPRMVSALVNNPTLLSQLTTAVTSKVLKSARATGNAFGQYAGGTQQATSTGINTNAVPR
jgi:hypothetical protein